MGRAAPREAVASSGEWRLATGDWRRERATRREVVRRGQVRQVAMLSSRVAKCPSTSHSGTYLASVAGLSGALRVGQLALHRGGEVVVRDRLRRARRHAVLDALDLVDEGRFVLRGPLGGHCGCNGRRYLPQANDRWHGRGRLVA